jgi:hypothetical protein
VQYVIYDDKAAIVQLSDKQLTVAINATTTETNRCWAEFQRLPTAEASIAYNNAMYQWLVLTGEREYRAWQVEYRKILLKFATVQRIQL